MLTHVIEDFVIQESSEPFPVTRSGMLSDLKRPHSTNSDQDDEPLSKGNLQRFTVIFRNKIGFSYVATKLTCQILMFFND